MKSGDRCAIKPDGQTQRLAQVLRKASTIGDLRRIGSTAADTVSRSPARSRAITSIPR